MIQMTEGLLYWKGCMSRLRRKSIADATAELLRRLGIPFEELEDEGCCGSVLLRTGFTADAGKVVRETAGRISSKNISEVVTGCPGCYRTMSSEYPLALGSAPFRVRHISQILYDHAATLGANLKPLDIGPVGEKVKVAYHDPCHLGRHMGVYEEPRALIRMIPCVELVEAKYSRSRALCCGSGGGVRSALPNVSAEVAKAYIEDAFLPTGARILVTACPFCNYQLSGVGIEVLDLPEILLRSWDSKRAGEGEKGRGCE